MCLLKINSPAAAPVSGGHRVDFLGDMRYDGIGHREQLLQGDAESEGRIPRRNVRNAMLIFTVIFAKNAL